MSNDIMYLTKLLLCLLITMMQPNEWGGTATTEETVTLPNILSKADWQGLEASFDLDKQSLPTGRVIICHTASMECDDVHACTQATRNIQTFHMKLHGFHDISYNFLIGGDGNVYEGRGWLYWPAVAKGFNNGSIALGFIGSYNQGLPTAVALNAAKSLIVYGVENNKIKTDYKLFGHRQLSATESPGSALYSEIKQWPNWSRTLN